jgi:hypothetical protein
MKRFSSVASNQPQFFQRRSINVGNLPSEKRMGIESKGDVQNRAQVERHSIFKSFMNDSRMSKNPEKSTPKQIPKAPNGPLKHLNWNKKLTFEALVSDIKANLSKTKPMSTSEISDKSTDTKVEKENIQRKRRSIQISKENSFVTTESNRLVKKDQTKRMKNVVIHKRGNTLPPKEVVSRPVAKSREVNISFKIKSVTRPANEHAKDYQSRRHNVSSDENGLMIRGRSVSHEKIPMKQHTRPAIMVVDSEIEPLRIEAQEVEEAEVNKKKQYESVLKNLKDKVFKFTKAFEKSPKDDKPLRNFIFAKGEMKTIDRSKTGSSESIKSGKSSNQEIPGQKKSVFARPLNNKKAEKVQKENDGIDKTRSLVESTAFNEPKPEKKVSFQDQDLSKAESKHTEKFIDRVTAVRRIQSIEHIIANNVSYKTDTIESRQL